MPGIMSDDAQRELSISTGQRVYVNNMNTLHATVTLPERRPQSLWERNMEAPGGADGYAGSQVLSGLPASGEAGPLDRATEGAKEAQRGSLQSMSNGQKSGGPMTAQGGPVHSNLQDVYNRIMRRLQRQMNYAEFPRTSLAEQYSVDLELNCAAETLAMEDTAGEASRKYNGKQPPRTVPPHTTSSSFPFLSKISDGANAPDVNVDRLSSRSTRRPGSIDPATASFSKNSEHDLPGLPLESAAGPRGVAGAGSSRLLQFKATEDSRSPQDRATIGGSIAERKGVTVVAESDVEMERDLGAQPCPQPLRLVVRHVLDTLQKKMSLAESGSLKDCIVFSFESRALLDRLLKEIPMYTQYNASQGPVGVVGPAGQQAITRVYQDLRKMPVLLPRAGFVEDAATGAIRGRVLSEGAAMKEEVGTVPNMAAYPPNFESGGGCGFAAVHQTFVADSNRLPEITLPSSYGKSARLKGGVTSPISTVSLMKGSTRGGAATQRTVLRDHLATGGGLSSTANSDAAASSSTAITAAGGGGARDGHGEAAAGPPDEPLSAFAAAHRATCRMSVGTLTDENSVTMVSQTEYATLQKHMDELKANLADVEMHRSQLTEQLCEEAEYTDQKKRVLQHLRETLVRECAMLRSQLRFAAGKIQQLQQQQSRGPAGPSGSCDAHSNDGPVAVAHVGTVSGNRSQKVLNTSVGSSPGLSMPSGLGTGSHVRRSQGRQRRLSNSGSVGNIPSGASIPSGGRPTGATTQGWPGSGSPGASFSVPPGTNTVSAPAAAEEDHSLTDLEAVQSLLDMVLIAVEEDAVISSGTLQMSRTGHKNAEVVRSGFHRNPKRHLEELQNEFDERQHILKKKFMARTAEQNFLLSEEKREVERLRSLTDTTRVRAILQEHVKALRSELHRLRNSVAEQLHFFKAILHNTSQSLLRRSALADKALSENIVLSGTVTAQRELIESASALLMPMLSYEYRCGYHPWPLKQRNTTDPLAHIIHLRYGSGEVVRLRDSLNIFGQLYGELHRYIMNQVVVPESTRPSAGKPLQFICSAMVLNPMSHTDVIFAARHAYDTEVQLRKRLARLNMRIMWNSYLQRTYTERSIAALVATGHNPRLTALPVAGRINLLAQERAALLQGRVAAQRERAENAKAAYRLWREKEIDIMEGYPVPQTQRNRLALLSDGGGLTGARATVNPGSSRVSRMFSRPATLSLDAAEAVAM